MFGKKKRQMEMIMAMSKLAQIEKIEEIEKTFQRGAQEFVNENYDLAFKLISNAAQDITVDMNEELYANIQYMLGVCYFDGEGVMQDYGKAYRYFVDAATHGVIDAKRCLGVCYFYGNGVARNDLEAIRLLSEVIQLGGDDDEGERLAGAWRTMAQIYFSQDSKLFNPNKGLDCLRKALELGDVEAIQLASELGIF